jgi:glycine cleavage system H protein
VTAVNEELSTAPEKINSDAHGSWMIKIKLKNPGDVNGLMTTADYEKYIAEEK